MNAPRICIIIPVLVASISAVDCTGRTATRPLAELRWANHLHPREARRICESFGMESVSAPELREARRLHPAAFEGASARSLVLYRPVDALLLPREVSPGSVRRAGADDVFCLRASRNLDDPIECCEIFLLVCAIKTFAPCWEFWEWVR